MTEVINEMSVKTKKVLEIAIGGLAKSLLTCPEDVSAAVAPGGELGVVAAAAVDPVRLGAELLVHQGRAALVAQEACLVPVLLLVGEVLIKGK